MSGRQRGQGRGLRQGEVAEFNDLGLVEDHHVQTGIAGASITIPLNKSNFKLPYAFLWPMDCRKSQENPELHHMIPSEHFRLEESLK